MLHIINQTIKEFCFEFLHSPYLCYTEHGLHALFYLKLYLKISENQRYIYVKGKKVCVIQKEYPTPSKLSKSKRQGWDIVILKSPYSVIANKFPVYDYLQPLSIIEFGMNANREHLVKDMDRLSHPDVNFDDKNIIHLYRISESGSRFSNRDLSQKSSVIMSPDQVQNLAKKHKDNINIYYCIVDNTKESKSNSYLINKKEITPLTE